MRTHALMNELRARLLGQEVEAGVTAPARRELPRDWPRLPCGPAPADPALLERLKGATVAQIGVGRAGARLRTGTYLKWLGDRAVAVEAVRSQLPADFAQRIGAAVAVHSAARDLDEFLLRPDLGRRLPEEALSRIRAACPHGPDVQVVVGDGLSATAVELNAPEFLQAFGAEATRLGLKVGATVLVERARVKQVDVVGAALGARTAIILVGERPGLGTGDGMSVYMVHQPRADAMDSDKEVLSNIHPRGHGPADAGRKVAAMLAEFLRVGASGVKRQAGASPAPQELSRAEPGRARDPVAERHAPWRNTPPPLQTVSGARCAG